MKYNIGDEVFWNDPACGGYANLGTVKEWHQHPSSICCCGYGKVTEVNGEIYSIKKDDGGELEAYEHELK